jgi:hypothetical protein
LRGLHSLISALGRIVEPCEVKQAMHNIEVNFLHKTRQKPSRMTLCSFHADEDFPVVESNDICRHIKRKKIPVNLADTGIGHQEDADFFW